MHDGGGGDLAESDSRRPEAEFGVVGLGKRTRAKHAGPKLRKHLEVLPASLATSSQSSWLRTFFSHNSAHVPGTWVRISTGGGNVAQEEHVPWSKGTFLGMIYPKPLFSSEGLGYLMNATRAFSCWWTCACREIPANVFIQILGQPP